MYTFNHQVSLTVVPWPDSFAGISFFVLFSILFVGVWGNQYGSKFSETGILGLTDDTKIVSIGAILVETKTEV